MAGVVALVIIVPTLSVPNGSLALTRSVGNVPANRVYLEEGNPSFRGEMRTAPAAMQVNVLQRQGLLRTTQGQYPQLQPATYTVQEGDTLSSIAVRYGVDEKTLIWANEALQKNKDSLSIGQELTILPLNGAYYTVAEGDTLDSIAKKYNVPAEAIVAYKGNNLPDPTKLTVGSKVIVPGAVLPDPPTPEPVKQAVRQANTGQTYTASVANPQPGSGQFTWPMSGIITQYYGGGHTGLDVYRPVGYPIVAADSGTVVQVSWLTYSYGYHIIIDHGNGLQTLYAHMSQIEVEVGQTVTKGQEVGKCGVTGRVTGPHLHFEVIQDGRRVNPLGYLP